MPPSICIYVDLLSQAAKNLESLQVMNKTVPVSYDFKLKSYETGTILL